MTLSIRHFVKNVLARGHLALIHQSNGRIAELLLAAYQELRFNPDSLEKINRAHSSAYLQKLLKQHSIDFVVDVGANRGQFATELRALAFQGEIVSFEPNPECLFELEQLRDNDSRWTIFPTAVGAEIGTAILHVFRDSSFSSLHKLNSSGAEAFGDLVHELSTLAVSLTTLDSALAHLRKSSSQRSLLLKTDTQGHDLDVIRGAGQLLQQVRVVIIEAAGISIYEETPSVFHLWQALFDAGFVLASMTPVGNRSVDGALIDFDTFFVRPSVTAK